MKEDQKKDWRFYENKMNQCFESGGKAQALSCKDKFVSLYRLQRALEAFGKAPKAYTPIDSLDGITFKSSSLPPQVREKIRRNVLIGDFSKFEKEYEKLLSAMGSEEIEKFNMPTDAFNMLKLFIMRYSDEGKVEPILRRGDFKLFHEMVKKELHLIGEIKNRIRVFADGGNKKYKKACISVLTGFEWDIPTLKSTKKLSVIIRHIQREGFLEQIDNIPSEKIMCGWIDTYRTQFYPNWDK